MPGTIHVTVVEFKGVSSSPKPSAKSLKVSMGKRQYQTWDKGDFSFPITRIGEDIVVALLDAGGNEIAHQDIGTMQVIEKGSWDEVFFINGGGHVHLKLHFTLSEEDRSRIRVMRESAMKKKLETNPNIKLRFLEYFTSTAESAETSMKDGQKVSASTKGFVEIDLTSPEVEASRAGSSPASAASSAASLSSHRMGGGAVVDSGIPNATDGIQDAPPSSHVEHKIDLESARVADVGIQTPRLAGVGSDNGDGPSSEMSSLVASTLQDDHLVRKPQKQGPVGKTPSNVRKMISAFETSQIQGVKSMKRAASVPSHLNRSSKEGFLEDRPTKSVSSTADKTSTDFKDHHLKNLHTLPTAVSERASKVSSECEPPQVKPSTVTPTLSESSDDPYAEYMSRASSSIEVEEGEKSSLDIRREIASETATSSGRMSEERSQPDELSSRLLKSSESSAAEASGRGRGTSLKSSTVINAQVASNLKQRTLEYYKEEYDSAQASGMWIFPDNTSRLCITTAGEQDMKIVGHYNNETKTHQANIISSENQKNSRHEKERKMGKKLKRLDHQPESGSAGSPNDSSNGLIGQVIKVAVIVGFGVLVLLTRQKEPWNKQKEDKDKDNLFYIPDYVDERALKPWTGKP